MLNRINVQRGVRGAALAAALGLGIAIVAAVAMPGGPMVSPAIYAMFACAGWLAYAPDGNHRLGPTLAGFFLLSYMAMDAASAALPGDPYLATFITVGGQIVLTMLLTAVRVLRV